MNLFKLVVDLALNASGFHLGMKQASGAAHKFSEQLNDEIKNKITSLFGVVALEEFARKTIDAADEILDLSTTLGISAKAVQEWGYAASKAGKDLQTATKFLENLAAVRERALSGNKDAKKLFSIFGISEEELLQSVDALGRKIADAVKKGKVQDLIGPLRSIGGKGAVSLIPSFKEGFDELAEAAARAGRIIDTQLLVQLKQMREEFVKLFSPNQSGATVITWMIRRVHNMVDGLKLTLGTYAAYLQAKHEGLSDEEATKVANSHMDDVFSDIAERDKKLEDEAAKYDRNGDEKPGLDKVLQSKASGQFQLGQTNWQRIGAATFYRPMEEVLNNIQRSTSETAKNTAGILDYSRENINVTERSELSGGFE